MKFKLICLAALLAITSCSNTNDELPTENKQSSQIQNVTKVSWAFPTLAGPVQGYDPNYYFEYDSQGRISKKIGGILRISSNTGLGDQFLNSIYTTISYTGNVAVMKTYSADSTYNPQLNERIFEFDSQGRVAKAVIPFPANPIWEKHLTYNYDASGKLVNILTEVPNMPSYPTDPDDYILTYLENFTYDASGNLQKAVTIERHNNIDALVIKDIEFSNFNSTPNPFKSLGIFEDYFYYSLSKNNFQKRVIKEYNGPNTPIDEKQWVYQYDAGGNIKLSF